MSNRFIGAVLLLAVLSGITALLVLLLPLGAAGGELSNRATVSSIEKLLTGLTKRDVRRISNYISDLAKAVENFEESREKSVLINAVSHIYQPKRSPEVTLRMIMHLKKKGIKDPNIDMFLAVMSPEDQNSIEQLQVALQAGANPNMTDGQLLAKYRAELEDFVDEQN